MWLKLYQSASIWLVFGLSRPPTHRSTVAAGADRMAAHRQQDRAAAMTTMTKAAMAARRRVMRTRLSRAMRGLQRSPRSRTTQRAMLRTYGPGCDGSSSNANVERIPDGATWIDLEEPTNEEEQLVERCIEVDVPTQDEMAEIEPSSRLYERMARST